MHHCIMLIGTLILVACNKALGDSCPVLDVKLRNISRDLNIITFQVYQYKEVDPVVMTPFYGIGDTSTNIYFSGGFIKITCNYFGKQTSTRSIDNMELVLTRINFQQNLNDNRIQLNYSGNTDDFFCGAVAKMKDIWLIDHLPCFISFYGCQMAKINGAYKKFEGVFIIKNELLSRVQCSYDDLHYTYDVLQNQAGIELSSLTNITAENYKLARRFCQIERDQMNMCKTFESDNIDKYLNLIFFVALTVGLTIIFAGYFYDKFVGFKPLL